MPKTDPRSDLVGRRYGRLIVIEYAGKRRWRCQCDCDTFKNIRGDNLRLGLTKSCGCLWQEVTSQFGQRTTTHGYSHTRVYKAWFGMLQRCENPNNAKYKDYGARGIKVCKRWHKFENFLADMGKRPKGMSIDRWPNNDGDYEPNNCRWATRSQQQFNRRPSKALAGMIGKRFGRLVVLRPSGTITKSGSKQVVCECDCGRTIIADGFNVRSGNTRSCGCVGKKKIASLAKQAAMARWHPEKS